eukprot:gene7637-8934_t
MDRVLTLFRAIGKTLSFPVLVALILFEKVYQHLKKYIEMSKHIPYSADTIDEQKEIKQSTELLDEKGQLAVKGWARQPILHYNPKCLSRFRRAYRLKEWNYYAVGTDRFYFAVAAIDLGYVTNYQTFFIDFASDNGIRKDEVTQSSITKSLGMPKDSCVVGTHIEYSSKNFQLKFGVTNEELNASEHTAEHDHNAHPEQCTKHHIQMTSNKMKMKVNLEFDLSPKRESVVLATPIGKNNFYYNRKTNLIPVKGSMTIDGVEMLGADLSGDAFGIMDWGRGIWDYSSFWIWSTSWGRTSDGRSVGLNIGNGFGDLSTHTENAINVEGIIHKLGHIDIEYDPKNLLAPWNFKCKHGRFGENALVFTPIRKKLDHSNFGIIMSHFHQIIGRFTGELLLDNGERIQIDIHGFTEVHAARW